MARIEIVHELHAPEAFPPVENYPDGRPRYTDAHRLFAFSEWLSRGCSYQAEAATGVKSSTIRNWRCRKPELWAIVVKDHEEALRDLRIAIAHEAANGLHAGAKRIRGILENLEGKLSPREIAQLVRALSNIDEAQDRIWRLNQDMPTEIIEERTDEEAVEELRKELEKVGIKLEEHVDFAALAGGSGAA